jgi:hypothetical protein
MQFQTYGFDYSSEFDGIVEKESNWRFNEPILTINIASLVPQQTPHCLRHKRNEPKVYCLSVPYGVARYGLDVAATSPYRWS